MKRLAVLLVAVGWLGWASNASAQTFVQFTWQAANGGTPFGSITETAGNTLIIVAACSAANCGTPPTVADTKGNTWTTNLVSCSGVGPTNGQFYAFAAYNIAGGANVVTLTTNLNTAEAYLIEYSGLAKSSAFDQSACQQQVSQNPSTSGNSTATTQAQELVIGFIAVNNSTRTAGSGYTIRDNSNLNSFFDGFEDKNVSSTGVQAATFATNGASTAGVMVVTFKAFVFAPQSGGQIISTPMFPQATPNVSYPSEAGYTITPISSGANLQTAINGAGCGTILSLAANGTFTTATPYTLPNNTCPCHTDPTKWTIIRSAAFAGGSTRGARLDPSSEYANLAHVSSSDANYTFAVTGPAPTASCYWFLGLDITETTANSNTPFAWGDAGFTIANYPHDVVIDHSYIHGSPVKNLHRCVMFLGNWEAIVDSYVSDCHYVGVDTNAVVKWDGAGPLLVQNNFLESSTEGTLVGGSSSATGNTPADISYIKNHYFKPQGWNINSVAYSGIHWGEKNIFEIKFGKRILVTGNVFQNSWNDAQIGIPVLFNPGCSSSSSPGDDVISDVNAYYNITRDVPAGINYGGCNGIVTEEPHRIYFHDNLYYNIDGCLSGGCGSFKTIILNSGAFPGPPFNTNDVWHIHETFASANMSNGIIFASGVNQNAYGIQFRDSIFDTGANGAFTVNADGSGNSVITNNAAPGGNFKGDCIYGPGLGVGNNANFAGTINVANQAAVFVTPGSNFAVAPASACHNIATDGTDPGANIAAVNAATSGVPQTWAAIHTVTNVSPSTFTNAGGTGITITGTNFLNESGLGVIVGGAGPPSTISTDSCGFGNGSVGQATITAFTDTSHFTYTGGCVVVMASPLSVALNDTINVVVNSSQTGGTINRYSPGNPCTSVSVTNSNTINCTTPAATGTVVTGPVSVVVSQYGIPVQSTVFGNYN